MAQLASAHAWGAWGYEFESRIPDKVEKYFIYILRNQKSGKFYIGSTNNLVRRLQDHNRGKVVSTKNKGSWTLIYTESFSTRSQAVSREKQIKSYKGGNAFKKIINN